MPGDDSQPQPNEKTEAEEVLEAPRPPVEDLTDVDPDEFVYRYVGFNAWDDNPPDGKHVTSAFIDKREFSVSANSYGASVWVESRLKGGIAALEQAKASLALKGLVRVPVREVLGCNVQVKLSPRDCDIPGHEDAHASFIGIENRPRRDALLDKCQAYVFRAPPFGSKRPP